MLESTEQTVVENRDKWIGGSDIPAIMGVSSFSSAYELAKGKFEKVEPPVYMQKYVDYGNDMEPKIRDYINEYYHVNYKPVVETVNSQRLRANVDGFDKDAYVPLLEIKTHGNTIRMEEYELQMQLYMYVFGVDKCMLALYKREEVDELFSFDDFDMVFNPDNLETFIIKRDNDALERILKRVQIFIDLLDARKHDTLSENEFDLELYGNFELMEQINKLDELMDASEKLKEYENHIKEVKENIRILMKDNDVRTIATDNYKVTSGKDTVTKRFDSKAFEKDHPELYSQYVKESKRNGSLTVTKIKK